MTTVSIILLACIGAVITAYISLDKEKQALDGATRHGNESAYAGLTHGLTRYELSGPDSGETVVFIHGGTIPHWAWDRQVQPFINAGFRVLRYDQYGRGLSDRPRVRYDRALYRAQIADLLKTLNIEKPLHVVGHSFGADIAADFASAYPHKINRLVLVSPLFNLLHYDTPYRVPAHILRMPLIGRLFMRFVIMPKSVVRARELFRSGSMDTRYERMFMEQITYKGFEHSLLSAFRHNFTTDYRDAFDGIEKSRVPALLIWGNKDTNVPRAVIDDIRAWAPSMRFIELDGIGHQPNWEATGRFNEEVMGFLGG
jgi:pimeloyl-ACP methyl ester carboxylesterase